MTDAECEATKENQQPPSNGNTANVDHGDSRKEEQSEKAEIKKIDRAALKLSLNDMDPEHHSQHEKRKQPMSAPTPYRRHKNHRHNLRNKKAVATPPMSARSYRVKRNIPYTPRLDELPLSLRLHSNPMVLLQSLRRQKVSNYNMYNIEPAIDNKPSKQLIEYGERRRKLRESNDPFPAMPKLPADIPIFVAKQYKYEVVMSNYKKYQEHKWRCAHMQPHIDNLLPKSIVSYRKMRRDRLKNAQLRARTLHEKRLQSPRQKPKPPTRKLPDFAKKSTKQMHEERKLREKQAKQEESKSATKKKGQATTYQEIVYVDEQHAKQLKFAPSPKNVNKVSIPEAHRRPTLVNALPCYFQEWSK